MRTPSAWACVLVPLIAGFLGTGSARAQTKTGTTFGSFLMIEPSARIAAMGNAGSSVLGGLDAAYYNVATLVAEERPGVSFSHVMWLADIAYDHVSVAWPLGRWGIAQGSLTALGSGDMTVRTVGQPLGTGETFDVSDLAVGIGYARHVTDRFSAGVRINYVQETIWNSSTHTGTLDFGTLYTISENGLRIGASLSHFGTSTSYDGRDLRILYDNDPDRYGDNSALPGMRFTDPFPVPVLFRVGLGLPIALSPDTRLLVAADAFHPTDNGESVSLGAEARFRDMLALRTGYQNLFLPDSEVGFTFGGGLAGDIDRFTYRVDYAWAEHGRIGNTQRFTLGFTF